MRIDRLTSISHPVYNRAMELYRLSFPFHEQRETPSQKAILKDEAYHFGLIQDDEQFVGLVLYWELEHCFYIEHFCVLPELRGIGMDNAFWICWQNRESLWFWRLTHQ